MNKGLISHILSLILYVLLFGGMFILNERLTFNHFQLGLIVNQVGMCVLCLIRGWYGEKHEF